MVLTDNVYLLDSALGSQCYIVHAKDTVLIDTGLPIRGKTILRKIKALNIRPKHILLTHHDIDRIGNAAMLADHTGAQVWASKEDIPYILGDIDRHGLKRYLKFIIRVAQPKRIKPLPDSISGIKVIPAPGHTPGHVCFLFRDILFVGDLLVSKRGILRIYPPAWNWDNGLMLQSVQKIADYPFKWICPSHGMPINFSPPLPPEIRFTLAGY